MKTQEFRKVFDKYWDENTIDLSIHRPKEEWFEYLNNCYELFPEDKVDSLSFIMVEGDDIQFRCFAGKYEIFLCPFYSDDDFNITLSIFKNDNSDGNDSIVSGMFNFNETKEILNRIFNELNNN